MFGWTFEAAGPEYGGYINAFKDGKPVAGLMFNDPQWNSPDGWTTYLHTADVKATHRQGHRGGRGRVRGGPPSRWRSGTRAGWAC